MVHEKNENILKVQHSGPIIQGEKNAWISMKLYKKVVQYV